MLFSTGTLLPDGFPPGLVGVYDESEGMVAVTEFGLRICNEAIAADIHSPVWLDVRNHVRDFENDFHLPLIVYQSDWTLEMLMAYLEGVLMEQVVVVIDSLPAIPAIENEGAAVNQAVVDMGRLAKESGSLVVLGTYATMGGVDLPPIGFGYAAINAMAHSVVCVTHNVDAQDRWHFGIRMPLTRHGVPVDDWLWDDAKLIVGA